MVPRFNAALAARRDCGGWNSRSCAQRRWGYERLSGIPLSAVALETHHDFMIP
jgi:hypothetical protein